MKRIGFLLAPTLFVLSGCVSIQDNVQVAKTSGINTNQNVTQKCDMKPYVVRVISAMGTSTMSAVGVVRDDASFDAVWNLLTLDSAPVSYPTVEGTKRPKIDWTNQQVYFIMPGKLSSTCQKIVPVKTETDCMSIFITLSNITYITNCQSADSYPIFVYIMPHTDLPVQVLWTDDADGDGFSNDSEIKLGTDPLDPNSHP